MNKALSFALLAGGILLITFGVIAYDSSSSDLSRLLTGSATDKSIWLLVSGSFVTMLGMVSLFRGATIT